MVSYCWRSRKYWFKLNLFLNSLGINEYKFIDNDSLLLENIPRHLLGFANIRSPKVTELKKFIQHKDPLIKVQTRNKINC